MKFLYFGDMHRRVTTPENRMDNFQETLKKKTTEILRIGKENDVKAYIQPGDFWDIPNPPLDYASETIKEWFDIDIFNILQEMSSQSEKENQNTEEILSKILTLFGEVIDSKITNIASLQDELINTLKANKSNKSYMQIQNLVPMVSVVGNHELFGNNINTLNKTMTGFMSQLGLMKLASKLNPIYFTTEDGLKVAITGTNYHLDIDSEEHRNDYVVEEKLGDYHIHVVHGLLSDKSMGSEIRHTLIDDIKHTKADLTITGHDHIGFPLIVVDGKYFVNTGAITRQSNDLKEMNRKPKVMLIDITREHGIRLKEVYLTTAAKGEEVLNRQKIIEKKEKEKRIDSFKNTIKGAGLKKSNDLIEIIRDIAENKEIPFYIRDSVIDKISEKMKEMGAYNEISVKDAIITKIIIENYESHEYTELEVSEGYNIFLGESRQGKSSVFRALDLIYENKHNSRKHIRVGATFAKSTVVLKNGYIISRYIEANKSGKNGYYITDPNTGETNFYNTKILPEVQRLLGFSPLYIDKDLQININFLRQGMGWFLIGDHLSKPVKAKIIGGIYGTQYVDAVTRDVEKIDKRTLEQLKDKKVSLTNVNNELEKYDYLDELKKSLDEIEKLQNEVSELMNRKNKIANIIKDREQLHESVIENEKVLNETSHLDEIKSMLLEAKEQINKANTLKGILNKRNEASIMHQNCNTILKYLQYVDVAKDCYNELEINHKNKLVLEMCLRKRMELNVKMENENEIISSLQDIDCCKLALNDIKVDSDKLIRIKSVYGEYKKLKDSLMDVEEVLNSTKHVSDARDLIDKVKVDETNRIKLKEAYERSMVLCQQIKDAKVYSQNCDKIIKITNNTLTAKNLLANNIVGLLEKKEKVVKISKEREILQVNIKKAAKVIDNQSRFINEQLSRHKVLLEKAGKCPVCHGTIDKITINRILSEYTVENRESA